MCHCHSPVLVPTHNPLHPQGTPKDNGNNSTVHDNMNTFCTLPVKQSEHESGNQVVYCFAHTPLTAPCCIFCSSVSDNNLTVRPPYSHGGEGGEGSDAVLKSGGWRRNTDTVNSYSKHTADKNRGASCVMRQLGRAAAVTSLSDAAKGTEVHRA